jgi:hypothetical protein
MIAAIQKTPAVAFVAAALLLFSTILLNSCTTTITKSKSPLFGVQTDTLTAGLNKMVRCENFNLDGREVTTNGKAASELEVDVMNGKNIPADNDRMRALARTIAVYLKSSLQDPREYDSYKILFVTKTMTSGVTTRNWTGVAFKREEL